MFCNNELFKMGYVCIVVLFDKVLLILSNKFVVGRMVIGNINVLLICWSCLNIFVF